MTVSVEKYADPLAVGDGSGFNFANAYTSLDAALIAECASGQVYANINEVTVSVTTEFTTPNQTLNFSGSGATARFISLVGTTLQYEVTSGTPAQFDVITGAIEGEANLAAITDDTGGTVTINHRGNDTVIVTTAAATTTAIHKLIIQGDFAAAKLDATKSRINVGNATALTLAANHIDIKGIQVLWQPAANSKRGITWTGTGLLTTDSVILKCAATGGNYIRGIVADGDLTLKNTIAIDIKRSSNDYIAYYVSGSKTLKVYNSILDNCYRGVWNNSTSPATVKNSVLNCNVVSGGTGATNLDNCATSAGLGANPVIVTDWNDAKLFYNRFLGDYQTAWDSVLLNAGIGSTVDAEVPANDIFGNAIPVAATTDIGVHYDVALHPVATDPRIEYGFSESSGLVCENNYNSRLNGVIGELLTVTDNGAPITEYQGYSADGVNHLVTYGTASPLITKWNTDYSVVIDQNTTPYSGYSTTPNTLGGCQVYNNKLYVSAENISNCQSYTAFIGIYDLSIAGFPLDSYIDLSAEGFEVGGVAVNAGAGYIYAVSFCVSNRVWIYNLSSPHNFIGYIDLDHRVHCNGIYYDSVSDSLFLVAKNQGSSTGCERIFNFSLTGQLLGSWAPPDISEIEDIDVSTGDFRYNCYPNARIRTATYPTAPVRTVNSIHLNNKYYIDVTDDITDETTFVFGIKATSFFSGNTVFDSNLSTTQWKGDIDAAGLFSFNIDGVNPVTYTLPSATTQYKAAITIAGSGATRTVKLYIDDVLQDTQTQDWIDPPEERFALGAGNTANTASDCEFFYFTKFDYALSSTELTNYTPPAPLSILLTVQNSLSAQSLDNVVLTQANVLSVNGSLSTQTIDNLALTQANTIAIDSMLSAQVIDNIDLTQANILIIDDSQSAQLLDDLVLSIASQLTIQESLSSQTTDNIDLTQANTIAIDSTLSAQLTDNLELTQANILIIDGSQSAQLLDDLVLSIASQLTIQESLSSQTTDNIDLTQSNTLVIDNTLLIQLLDSLFINNGVNVPTGDLVLLISDEGRLLVVTDEHKKMTIH